MSPLSSAAPGSTATLRVANRQRVLDLLRRSTEDDDVSTFTQAEIARATGLAPATVSNIVRDLAASGVVATEAGSGRRGSSVRLAPSAGTVAGVDFGHSHVAVALADLTGHILVEERRTLAHDHPHLEHREALRLASDLLTRLAARHSPVRHVGLGLPAPVTGDAVGSSAIFPGWEGVNPRQVAEECFSVPVSVENDANLGALAEHRQGVGRGHDSSVFVKISSGVGAGIIIDNQLYHGAGGTAGEIGHLTLDEQGPLCRCGSRGCLEAYTSSGPVLEMMAAQLPEADLDDIFAAARDGHIAAQRALEDAGLHLGWALASIVNLINPAIVVVGGDMARAGEQLLASARIGLRRHALDSVATTPVLASQLGARASLVGAVLLAAERTELVAASD